LQDHSAFQFLELAGIKLPWRILPYNSAEPFWTVAIEMWIYVAAGLFFFCAIKTEPLDRRWLIALSLVSFPVVVWNAAAGGGKSLTLIWIVGALIGLVFHRWRATGYASARVISLLMVSFGAIALVGRIGKVGFSPYDLQTATLLAIILFGILAYLITVATFSPRWKRWLEFAASYSYSLYLLHNTVLIAVLESLPIEDIRVRAAIAVVLAHVCSYLLYLGFERHYRTVGAWLTPRFETILRFGHEAVSAPAAPQGGTTAPIADNRTA
jgi:peptidoglycan/LPS O-acetylase OafA/YrhL